MNIYEYKNMLLGSLIWIIYALIWIKNVLMVTHHFYFVTHKYSSQKSVGKVLEKSLMSTPFIRANTHYTHFYSIITHKYSWHDKNHIFWTEWVNMNIWWLYLSQMCSLMNQKCILMNKKCILMNKSPNLYSFLLIS